MTEFSEESLLRLGGDDKNDDADNLIKTVPLLPSKEDVEQLKEDKQEAIDDARQLTGALIKTHRSVEQALDLLKVLQSRLVGKVALGLAQSLAWILEEAVE